MGLRFDTLAIDAHDPDALARWWGELLGWSVEVEDPDHPEWVTVAPPPDAPGAPPLLFAPVPETKAVKNRLHLDLRPDDQDAEVARAEALGARRVEVGQSEDPEATWVVLADPEGNEFCILRSA